MDNKLFRAAISFIAVAVAVAHAIWPHVPIDGITLLALVVAVLPWLQPLFKSVELPGGLKVEFQEVKQASDKAKAAGLVGPAPATPQQDFSFQSVAESDPNLALAGLRIELEKRLYGLASANGYQGRARGIGNLLRHLESRELLTHAESAAIRDIVGILNEAVHGASIERPAAELALDFGTDVLLTLDSRIAGKHPD
jgi:hypothetical protein